MTLRILFVTQGKAPDYLNDCLYHGLKYLDEVEVYSTARLWYMYDDISPETKSALYGKGFTVYGRVPADKKGPVLGSLQYLDLRRRVRDRFFDLIIYGSIWRCSTHLEWISRYYPREKIFLVDGEDHQRINRKFPTGVYFKRENISAEGEHIYPISFGVPEELVLSSLPEKEKYWATVIPGNLATYVFDSESAYFEDYQRSRFAITTKKGGWDCLRHYEIMMNGCVPYFPFIENCPPKTMVDFPKEQFLKCRDLVDRNSISDATYAEKANYFLHFVRERLTTKALALHVLDHWQGSFDSPNNRTASNSTG